MMAQFKPYIMGMMTIENPDSAPSVGIITHMDPHSEPATTYLIINLILMAFFNQQHDQITNQAADTSCKNSHKKSIYSTQTV